jgi:hypothetical protein
VIVDGTATVIAVEPDLVESCVEVAVTIAVPAAVGVKTPAALTLPMVEGLTDQLTKLLKLPVPVTVGAQVDVWFVWMEAGEQATVTEVIVESTVTVIVAEPDLVESSVEVAVMVAVPAPVGVKTPETLTVPILVGLTDHVTAEL